jgi:K+-transporting ATPase c subunit
VELVAPPAVWTSDALDDVIAKNTSIANTVAVSTSTLDPNLTNNTASITTRVQVAFARRLKGIQRAPEGMWPSGRRQSSPW